MKNPPFHYHRPETLDEALRLLDELGDDAKVLAGGQSLLPTLALRLGPPAHLIDIGRLTELDFITVDEGVTIGALVRHAQAERSAEVAEFAPIVASALPHIGHRAIRTRGTVVGSIAHADAAGEMPAVCLATDAEMQVASHSGSRSIAAANFFDGHFSTTMEPTELLTAVHFPLWPTTAVGTVVEIARRHHDYAMAGLACMIDVHDNTITSAALSFFGVASKPTRVAAAEEALIGTSPNDASFAAAAAIVEATLDPDTDIHATAAYKRQICNVLTRRGLAQAHAQLGVAA